MKKLFIIGAIAIGTIESAFPFRSSCGIVFHINNDYAASVTREKLTHTLMQLNYSACGTVPSGIIYYTS